MVSYRFYSSLLKFYEIGWEAHRFTGKLFAAQALRLHTRGDLGNLANLNIKAYQAWVKFKKELSLEK